MSQRSADLCNVQYALALQVEHQNNSSIFLKKIIIIGLPVWTKANVPHYGGLVYNIIISRYYFLTLPIVKPRKLLTPEIFRTGMLLSH